MKKEKDIIIRVTKEFKDKLKVKANSLGLSLSAYIRLILIENL